MPIYIYEIVGSDTNTEAKRFEIQQSIHEEALTHHPDSGEPVRRVITGGLFLPKISGIHTDHDARGCCGTC
ncbi:MAG: FmdB family zinc ribbon protein [Puniceicoccales bacterium]